VFPQRAATGLIAADSMNSNDHPYFKRSYVAHPKPTLGVGHVPSLGSALTVSGVQTAIRRITCGQFGRDWGRSRKTPALTGGIKTVIIPAPNTRDLKNPDKIKQIWTSNLWKMMTKCNAAAIMPEPLQKGKEMVQRIQHGTDAKKRISTH